MASNPPTTRKLRIFRKEGDNLVPYALELDDNLVVVSEERVPASEVGVSPLDGKPMFVAPQLTIMAEDVATYSNGTDEQRATITTLSKWINHKSDDNPIPGSEALRTSFLREMRAKEKELGVKCRPCDLGAIMRRYKKKLEAAELI